jgi:hypothetical protein
MCSLLLVYKRKHTGDNQRTGQESAESRSRGDQRKERWEVFRRRKVNWISQYK